MVKRYLEGKIMSDIPLHLLKQIGADTAKLHKITVPDYLRDIMWCGKERFNEVKEYALNSPFDLWLKDTHSYIDKNTAPDLPKAFIHSDIFDSNSSRTPSFKYIVFSPLFGDFDNNAQ